MAESGDSETRSRPGRIYVTGHRNPDTDSIASAIAYAELKGRLDPGNEYVAVRLGSVNAQTAWALRRSEARSPELMEHVMLRVRDVMREEFPVAENRQPLREVGRTMAAEDLDLVPVVDDEGVLIGVMTERALARRYIREARKSHTLRESPTSVAAIVSVLEGEQIEGGDETVAGRVWVHSIDASRSDSKISEGDAVVVGNRVDAQRQSIELGAALIVTSNGVPLSTRVARVSAAPSAVSLTGGVDAAAASGEEQDITIAADATGVAKNGVVFRYTGGATAGAEVVTVTASLITVQIQSGVSTATQVATALGLVAGFTSVYNVTVSGTGSNAQVASTKSVTTSGAAGDPLGYYITSNAATALTASFVRFALPFPANKIEIANDEASGTKTVIVSLDGTNTDVTLDATESVSYSTDTSYFNAVWLKYGVGAPAYRLKAYGI